MYSSSHVVCLIMMCSLSHHCKQRIAKVRGSIIGVPDDTQLFCPPGNLNEEEQLRLTVYQFQKISIVSHLWCSYFFV
jgi:hypothetical protein